MADSKDLANASKQIQIIFEQAQLDEGGGGMFLVRIDYDGRAITNELLQKGDATIMEQFACWVMDVIMARLAEVAAQDPDAAFHKISKSTLN